MYGVLVFIATQLLLCVNIQSKEIFILSSNLQHELKVEKNGVKNSNGINLRLVVGEERKTGNASSRDAYHIRYNIFKKECIDFELPAKSIDDVLKVCIDIGDCAWFGGPEQFRQMWPLNKYEWNDLSYVTIGDTDEIVEKYYQAVIESYFLNSNGFYIYVNESVPLFLDMNGQTSKNKLCFISKVKPPYRKKENRLKFRVCKYENARVAHENAVNDILGKPISIPDPYLIKNPIWSTWAKYKKNVDTKTVLDYANQIVKSAYPRGQLEIDDDWETCYGSAIFNKNKFPDVKQLVKELKSLGFKVSLWTHPFISPQCESYEFAKTKDFFVKNTTGSIETAWWNGAAALVDFTNPSARDWWSGRLKKLLVETGIDTLKFDAGESSWGPPSSVYYDKDLTFFPDNIVNAYIDTINEFGNGIEYRTARKVQKHGRFVRMNDRNSRWDWQLGLPTLVTTLIQFNMIGYPFVLPDMIGGNAYKNDTVSDELFIRWMQANTFMPAVQFSLTPWDYNEKTNSICKKFIDLHQKYADLIVQLMENAVSTGTPVNPPIWWIDPTDTTAFYIDDEFLLGEDILVAPIMVQNAIKRNIYLPAGKWKDENNPNGSLINGRKWIYDYTAGLEVLPWFTRVRN